MRQHLDGKVSGADALRSPEAYFLRSHVLIMSRTVRPLGIIGRTCS